MNKRGLILTLCLVTSLKLASQEITKDISFTNYSVGEGLPTHWIETICQDSFGYLWIGTSGSGIVRFDGITFKNYSFINNKNYNPKTIFKEARFVNHIYEDSKKMLWAATERGIYVLNRDKERFEQFSKETNDNLSDYGTSVSFYKIVESTDSLLIILSRNGELYELNNTTKEIDKINIQSKIYSIAPNYFNRCISNNFCFDKNNDLWFGTINGLRCYQLKSKKVQSFLNAKDSAEMINILSVAIDANGNIWCGTNKHGLIKFNPIKNSETYFQRNERNVIDTCEVFIARNNEIWVTKRGEILSFNEESKFNTIVKLENNLFPEFLKEDLEGTFWLSIKEKIDINHPAYFHPKKRELITFKNNPQNTHSFQSAIFPKFNQIWIDRDNVRWFGAIGGISKIDPLINRLTLKDISLDGFEGAEKIYPIKKEYNSIWFYVQNKNNRFLIIHNPLIKDSRIYNINSGNYFIFKEKLFLINKNTLKEYNTLRNDFIPSNLVYKKDINYFTKIEGDNSYLAEENNFWNINDSSIILFKINQSRRNLEYSKSYRFIEANKNLKKVFYHRFYKNLNDIVITRLVDNNNKSYYLLYNKESDSFFELQNVEYNIMGIGYYKGFLYCASYFYGLLVINPENGELIKSFNTHQSNFPEDQLYDIVKDENNILWISSERGIYLFNPENESWKFIDNKIGLNIKYYNNKGFDKLDNNTLALKGHGYFRIFNPRKVVFDTIPPRVTITNFSLNNAGVLPSDENSPLKVIIEKTREITLRHNQNVISLNYAALHFIQSERIEYAHIMEGVDKDWQYVGTTRTVNYSGLSPGTYTFKVKAKNVDGVWSKEPTILKIIVLPPWWLTWLAKFSYLLLLLLAIFLIVKIRIKQLKNRQKQLELEINNATEEIKTQKEEVETTLDQLKQTQAELIQSEKMASLGQLIAGIAHEINTPLGAINASVGAIIDANKHSLKHLPELVKKLKDKELVLFLDLVNQSMDSSLAITSKEERTHRRKIIVDLENKNIPNTDELADMLVDMGIYDNYERFIPVLNKENLTAAYHLGQQMKNSRNIKTAVERASKIVFALKSYARYDQSEEAVMASVPATIETVLTLYQNQLKHGIELIKDYEEVPMIRCYPDELNQVWTNIIHNSIQAMQGRGKLSIYVQQRNGNLTVKITDTGKGIPEENLAKIFDAFYTTKPPGEGSGLGLYIVMQIIDKHKGTIKVESEEGKGTTFIVELPNIS